MLVSLPALRADDTQDGPPKTDKRRGPRGGGPIKFILDHADDLSLTAEQKTQLQALAKTFKDSHPPKPTAADGGGGGTAAGGPPSKFKEEVEKILTKDQLDKLHELMKAAHPEGGPEGDGGPDGQPRRTKRGAGGGLK